MKKLLLCLVFIFAPLFLFAYTSPGSPTGFVNDFAGIFTAQEKVELEQKLVNFEKESSNEISVVTIKTLDGESIETYAVKLFEEWKIGKEVNDNGVLLLVALDEREMRIEVGYGLEGALPDALTSSIIRNTLVPAFQKEEYYTGITSAVIDMMSATRGEYTPTVSADNNRSNAESSIDVLYFFIFSTIPFLVSFLGMSKSWWQGGVIGGSVGLVLGFFSGSSFFVGIFLTVMFSVLGLFFDYIFSKAYQHGKQTGHMPWWIGRGGRGGGFGGGFGGFGGGRSGGGGSSGKW